MKVASGIKDQEAFSAFAQEQVELAQSGLEKVVADGKALFEDTKAYNEEVLNIVKESASAFTPKS